LETYAVDGLRAGIFIAPFHIASLMRGRVIEA
jgi:hypothetical protein